MRNDNSFSSGDVHQRGWFILLASLVLAAMTVAAFSPLLMASFINLDDNRYVTENAHVQAGLAWSSVSWAFTNIDVAFYYPLTWISHMLDWQLYGAWAGGHHLTSVLLHGAGTILLFLFLVRVTGGLWRSFAAALLFALHPMHVESVAWISERKDVLSTALFMAALLAYLAYARKPSPARYAVVLAALLLGLLSKAMLITAPFLFLLLDVWPLGRLKLGGVPAPTDPGGSCGRTPASTLPSRTLTQLLLEKVPFLVLSGVFVVLTFTAQLTVGAVATLAQVSFAGRIVNAVSAYGFYLSKLAVPTGLCVFYPMVLGGPGIDTFLGVGVLLVLVTVWAWVRRGRSPYLIAGWLWYLVALVPVIGLVQIGAQAAADRYTYLSFVGLFWVLAWGGSEFVGRHPRTAPWLAGVAAVWLLTILAATVSQVEYWKNSERLFGRALAVTKNNAQAENGYGVALLRDGRAAEALPHFQAAVKIWPFYFIGWANLGTAYYRMGDVPRAESCLWRANRLRPGDYEVVETLAECCLQRGHPQESEAALKAVVALQPDRLESRFILGKVLAAQGKRREALVQFEEILNRDPRNVSALSARGQVQLELDLRKDAEASFDEALEIDPGFVAALTGLSRTLALPGASVQDLVRSVALAKTACEATRYQNPLTLQALLSAYEAAGLTAQAEDIKARLRRLDPGGVKAPPGPGAGTADAPPGLSPGT